MRKKKNARKRPFRSLPPRTFPFLVNKTVNLLFSAMNGKSICSECFPSPLPPALKIASGLISEGFMHSHDAPENLNFPFPQEKKNLLANFSLFLDSKNWWSQKLEGIRKNMQAAVPCTPCWMRFRRMNDYGRAGKNKILELCGRANRNYFLIIELLFAPG